jgi:hypothetical protein
VQTIVQVICSKGPSLREKIAKDAALERSGLCVLREKQALRSPGWMKVVGIEGQAGAINVEWDADTSVLICRVITRGANPSEIIGDLVRYILDRHRRRVRAIQVFVTR